MKYQSQFSEKNEKNISLSCAEFSHRAENAKQDYCVCHNINTEYYYTQMLLSD